MELSRSLVLPLLLTLAAPGAFAGEYLVFLDGADDLEGVARRSSSVVQRLQAAHQAAWDRVTGSFRSLALTEADVEHLWITNAVALTCDAAQARALASTPGVDRVQPAEHVPLLPARPSKRAATEDRITWSIERVGAPAAWAAGYDGRGVVVGHIDTGVDGTHPDLKGKVIRFRDFVDSSNHRPIDGDGHGTHTAGTIVGGAAGGTAIGVAPKAKLIVARVLTTQGANSVRLIRSMQWMLDPDGNNATDDAPDICSNSWGSNLGIDPTFWLSVRSWRKAGIVPVFAAGNEGPDAKTVGVPGAYPHSYTVGATDDRDRVAGFSSRGPVRWTFKTYIKPDVSAPGDFIYSARDGGGYTYLSGTSMATPAVAGALALMKQRWPLWSVSDLEAQLARTARDKGAPGKDNDYGKGIIDVARAMGLSAVEGE